MTKFICRTCRASLLVSLGEGDRRCPTCGIAQVDEARAVTSITVERRRSRWGAVLWWIVATAQDVWLHVRRKNRRRARRVA